MTDRSMKVIIAGSRTLTSYRRVWEACADKVGDKTWPWPWTEVVSGGALGVDRLGEAYAREMRLPIAYFYPDWKTHGRAAGPIRNRQMAEYADALIAITTGSRGTADMIRQAEAAGLLVYVVRVPGDADDD